MWTYFHFMASQESDKLRLSALEFDAGIIVGLKEGDGTPAPKERLWTVHSSGENKCHVYLRRGEWGQYPASKGEIGDSTQLQRKRSGTVPSFQGRDVGQYHASRYRWLDYCAMPLYYMIRFAVDLFHMFYYHFHCCLQRYIYIMYVHTLPLSTDGDTHPMHASFCILACMGPTGVAEQGEHPVVDL